MNRARKTGLEREEFILDLKRVYRRLLHADKINAYSIEQKIQNSIQVGAKAVDPSPLENFFSGAKKFTMKELAEIQGKELIGLLDTLKLRDIFKVIESRIKEVARENKIDLSTVLEEDLSHANLCA